MNRTGLWLPVSGFFLMCCGMILGPNAIDVISGPVIGMSLVAGAMGIRRSAGPRRLWWLMFGALVLFTLSVVVRDIDSDRLGVEFAFPSVADLVTGAGFLLLISSLLSVVRSRSRRGELAQYADMVIVCVAATSLYWVFVLNRVVGDGQIDQTQKMVTFVFAVLDVALVALVVRLLVGPGIRNRALVLIAATVTLLVMSDFAVAIELTGVSQVAWVVTPLAMFGFLTGAAVFLDPSLPEVLTPRPQIADRVSSAKTLALGIASLMPVLMLGLRPPDASALDNYVRLILALVGGTLLCVRMFSLVRDQERRSELERSVRIMSANLSAAEDPKMVFDETVSAGHAVLGTSAGIAVLSQTTSGNYVVEASSVRALPAAASFPSTLFPEESFDQVLLSSLVAESSESDSRTASLAVPFRKVGGGGGLVVVETKSSFVPDQVHAVRNIAGEYERGLHVVAQHKTSLRQHANDRLQTLTANSSTALLVVDTDGRVEFCTPNAKPLLGYSDAELLHTEVGRIFVDEDRHMLEDLLEQVVGLQESLDVELIVETPGSGQRWFLVTLSDQHAVEGISGVVVALQDIDDRHKSEARVLRSEARFRSLVQRSSDIVAICDEDGILTYISPACREILGYEPAELIGTSVLEVMSMTAMTDTSQLRDQLSSGSVVQQTFDIRTAAKDGSWRHLTVVATNLTDDPAVEGFVLNVRDDTERLSLERTLRHQATHDSLTKLANRTQLNTALEDVLADATRRDEVIGVMFLDLDDFKTINDGLGHAAGDQVLVAIGDRLRRIVRMNDVVARFGGDEFAVLLTNMYGEHEALETAARILEEVAQPLAIEGRNLSMSASIGVAFDRQRTVGAADLIKKADVAMYTSKDKGKGRVSVFNESMMTTAGGRLDLIDSLRAAIDDGEIKVHYQPIVNMKNERIVGFEALARWEHPERGMISPAGFIPVAEETGLIEPLGLSVLTDAAEQLGKWVANGHDIYVSVNVSVKQLQNPSVVRTLSKAVENSGLAFERVLLEVTESVFVADKDLVADRLRKLREKGFRIAIDDFGTGYSSLQYLQQFDFDVLKIDKSFVDRIGTTDDTGMVQTVLDLANRMGATTVAEGIEHAQQASELRRLRCELGQGYYYARPMSAEKTESALASEPLPLRNETSDMVVIDAPVDASSDAA